MNFYQTLTSNMAINAAVLAWLIAQATKVALVLICDRKLDFSRLVGSGGMPSSHTAFIIALTTAVWRACGFASMEFAIAFAMSMIVMVDASGVRRAAGEQAKILNKIVEYWGAHQPELVNEKLKELVGHTPVQVFVGALLGVAVGLAV